MKKPSFARQGMIFVGTVLGLFDFIEKSIVSKFVSKNFELYQNLLLFKMGMILSCTVRFNNLTNCSQKVDSREN